MVVADLPPPPPAPVRGRSRVLVRGFFLVLALALAVLAGYGIARASGRWWVGGIVFAIVSWVALLLGIGFIGAVKVEREDRARRAARAQLDPIGRLLPVRSQGRRTKADLDPAAYAALFALEPRPALVLDLAVTKALGDCDAIGSLAPRGRMPEPEVLDITHRVKGTSFGALLLLAQSGQFWLPIVRSLGTGAPLSWLDYLGFVILGIAIWMIVSDPLVQRFFGFLGLFRQESVIGAGWIRDDRGEVWTVDDSIVLVTAQGLSVEVRLVKPGKVRIFHLNALSSLARTRTRAKKRGVGNAPTIGDMARGAAQSVGVEPVKSHEHEMPTSKEPLRLLLSSWTYPEPRTDLAMRE